MDVARTSVIVAWNGQANDQEDQVLFGSIETVKA